MPERSKDDLRFDAMRNAIYHTARRQYLDSLNRWLNFVIIVAGTAAAGDLGKQFGVEAAYLAGLTALAGTLQLVFDFSGRARTHEFLQRRYYELIAAISEPRGEEQIPRWEAELNRLYSEEPPPMRALDAIAYNAACDSLGFGHGKRVKVT